MLEMMNGAQILTEIKERFEKKKSNVPKDAVLLIRQI